MRIVLKKALHFCSETGFHAYYFEESLAVWISMFLSGGIETLFCQHLMGETGFQEKLGRGRNLVIGVPMQALRNSLHMKIESETRF